MLNIVLFGPPGAGKGTQSQRLIDHYQLVHLSTGDMLRSEIKGETKSGLEAKSYIDAGKLVPDEVVIDMIDKKIADAGQAKGFIFDGFPRTIAQAEALDELLNNKDKPITAMIALEVEEEELVKRLLERGKESGRSDDQDEKLVRSRIQEYKEKTLPVADYYDKQGKFISVNGIGEIDEIFNNLCQKIDQLKAGEKQ